jgi:hypothetical protein
MTVLALALGSPGILAQSAPAGSRGWAELVRLVFQDGGLSLHLGPVLLLLVAAFVVVGGTIWAWRWRGREKLRKWDTTSVKVKFGNVAEIEVRPNYETVRLAYQAWVEIMTRKVGLPFDEEHDLIAEVYDSWYRLFGVLRELTKSVPAHRIRACPDTQRLVGVMLDVLNKGLRPHLTRWQARFRTWYDTSLEEQANRGKAPQDIQKTFPQYRELVSDLRGVNGRFVEFAAALRQLAEGCER